MACVPARCAARGALLLAACLIAGGGAAPHAASLPERSFSARRPGGAAPLRAPPEPPRVSSILAASAAASRAGNRSGAVALARDAVRAARTAADAARGAGGAGGGGGAGGAAHRVAADVLGLAGRHLARAISCLGPEHALEAWRTFEGARRAGPTPSPDDAWVTLELLHRLGREHSARAERAAADLARARGYAVPAQLPRSYVRGLAPAAPFHALPGAGGGPLAAFAAALEGDARALAREAAALAAAGRLAEEEECIHAALPGAPRAAAWRAGGAASDAADASAGAGAGAAGYAPATVGAAIAAAVPAGAWRVRHAWMAGACVAPDAPLACALGDRLAALSGGRPRVQRVGYSVLGAGTRLAPHYGPTNQMLKMHLGVVVPEGSDRAAAGGDPAPCATLTVGGVNRSWSEGGVLFFDDSFLHEAVNECALPRVVLQLQFDHPSFVADAPGGAPTAETAAAPRGGGDGAGGGAGGTAGGEL